MNVTVPALTIGSDASASLTVNATVSISPFFAYFFPMVGAPTSSGALKSGVKSPAFSPVAAFPASSVRSTVTVRPFCASFPVSVYVYT